MAPVSDRRRPCEPQHAQHHERPHEVELLLDRQRPHVQHGRGSREGGEVRLAREQEPPVRAVAEGREHVAPQAVEPERGRHERRVRDHRREHHEQCGEQPAGATGPERQQVDVLAVAPFAEQQPGDEESGQHEEGVERQHAAGREVAGVHRDGEPDGEPAPPVERGPVRAAGARRSRHVAGGSAPLRPWMDGATSVAHRDRGLIATSPRVCYTEAPTHRRRSPRRSRQAIDDRRRAPDTAAVRRRGRRQ